MNNKSLYIIAGVLLFAVGFVTGNIPRKENEAKALKHNHTHSDFRKVTPADLYLRSPSGSCTKATVCSACIASIFQMGVAVGQSKAISTSGTQYTLWDNANCSTANGGQQIALFP